MKKWMIKHDGWGGMVEIEAENKRAARKAFDEEYGCQIESIEEKIDIMKLLDKAEAKLVELFKPMKHLEIDDLKWGENCFEIPVFYADWVKDHPESRQIREFRFGRDSYETEAEMVDRFNRELEEFASLNWKKLDK